jgi:hypothetical protein
MEPAPKHMMADVTLCQVVGHQSGISHSTKWPLEDGLSLPRFGGHSILVVTREMGAR